MPPKHAPIGENITKTSGLLDIHLSKEPLDVQGVVTGAVSGGPSEHVDRSNQPLGIHGGPLRGLRGVPGMSYRLVRELLSRLRVSLAWFEIIDNPFIFLHFQLHEHPLVFLAALDGSALSAGAW